MQLWLNDVVVHVRIRRKVPVRRPRHPHSGCLLVAEIARRFRRPKSRLARKPTQPEARVTPAPAKSDLRVHNTHK